MKKSILKSSTAPAPQAQTAAQTRPQDQPGSQQLDNHQQMAVAGLQLLRRVPVQGTEEARGLIAVEQWLIALAQGQLGVVPRAPFAGAIPPQPQASANGAGQKAS